MSSILPTVSPKRQKSPTRTGWSAMRLTLPKRFSSVFWALFKVRCTSASAFFRRRRSTESGSVLFIS